MINSKVSNIKHNIIKRPTLPAIKMKDHLKPNQVPQEAVAVRPTHAQEAESNAGEHLANTRKVRLKLQTIAHIIKLFTSHLR